MGLFDNIRFTFQKDKILNDAIEKINSSIDLSKYPFKYQNELLSISKHYRSKVASSKSIQEVNDYLDDFKRHIFEINLKFEDMKFKEEQERKKKEELRIQNEVEEIRKQTLLAIERRRKESEYGELIAVCNNVLKFIDYVDIVFISIPDITTYSIVDGYDPLEEFMIFPELDVCECLDLLIIIADIDNWYSDDKKKVIKETIEKRKLNCDFNVKTLETYNKYKCYFMSRGIDISDMRINNNKRKDYYLLKKHECTNQWHIVRELALLGFTWEGFEFCRSETIDRVFYDDEDDDSVYAFKRDYINLYAKLYKRHLEGKFFYPDDLTELDD